MTSLGGDPITGHLDVLFSVVSLRDDLITDHLGTLTLEGTLRSSHLDDHKSRSDPLDIRVLRLGTLNDVLGSGCFGMSVPTDSATPGLEVRSHRSSTVYFTV